MDHQKAHAQQATSCKDGWPNSHGLFDISDMSGTNDKDQLNERSEFNWYFFLNGLTQSADFLPNCAHICLDNQLIMAKFYSLGCSLCSHPRLLWRQKMRRASTLHINFENCVIFRSTPTVYHHVFSLIDFALLLLRLPPSNIMLHILQYAIFYHTFYLLQP